MDSNSINTRIIIIMPAIMTRSKLKNGALVTPTVKSLDGML